MKPLHSVQITRDNKGYSEWESSEHHMTDDGRAEFLARQRARIAAADKARAEEEAKRAKVQPITTRRKA